MTRKCGGCQLCCEIFGVAELDKEQLKKCKHQCESGCGIYVTRPRECKIYQCLWKFDENVPEAHRPDRLGVVIDKRETPIGPAIVVHQKKPNQWRQNPVWPILQHLCKDHNCWLYCVCEKDREAVFPTWAIEAQKRFDDIIQEGTAPEMLGELIHYEGDKC